MLWTPSCQTLRCCQRQISNYTLYGKGTSTPSPTWSAWSASQPCTGTSAPPISELIIGIFACCMVGTHFKRHTHKLKLRKSSMVLVLPLVGPIWDEYSASVYQVSLMWVPPKTTLYCFMPYLSSLIILSLIAQDWYQPQMIFCMHICRELRQGILATLVCTGVTHLLTQPVNVLYILTCLHCIKVFEKIKAI